MQDNLTKYYIAPALPNQTASTVANALIRRFIRIYGSLKTLFLDRRTNFLSDIMKESAKQCKIQNIHTIFFHPQSNGSLDKTHIILNSYIKNLSNQIIT